MNILDCALVLFFLVVIGLLAYYNLYKRQEAFLNGSAAGEAAPRCGVEFPACPPGTRCVNGYCASVDPPRMAPMSDLPVLPLGAINGRP